jgi:quercetin dioxygenase-like cupin family protein
LAVDAPRVIGSGEGAVEFLGSIGARFLIDGEEAGQRFALVEHPMPPRALASPIHRHHREDEYSFVLEGDVGVLLGEAVVTGRTGDLIVKPRGQWHTFWNAGDAPARVLEIISPAGFETFFRALAAELKAGAPDPQRVAAISRQYEVDMDLASVPGLVQRFGVRFPGGPP